MSETKLPFTQAEYQQRWDAAHAQMKAMELGAAVVWSRGGGGFDRFQEVFYLTNYYSSNSGYAYDWMQRGTRAAAHCAVLLRPGREPILVADDPTVDPRGIATPHIAAGTDVVDLLAQVLERENVRGEVGFVGMDCISATHLRQLSERLAHIRWREADQLLVPVRLVKSPAELDIFREAGRTVTAAMDAMFGCLLGGGSEAEAAGEAARHIYARQGNLNFCYLTHGTDAVTQITDCPMAGYSTRRPPEGAMVRGWLSGAMRHGYWLDPGRTTVIGLRPTSDQRRLIETCAEVVEQMREQVRPGVSARDIAAFGRQRRDAFQGTASADDDWFGIFGHGNGLFWDPPILSPLYDGEHQLFLEGMVASTELFLDVPGVGSAGFEQNFIVTATGTELLTTTPLVWW